MQTIKFVILATLFSFQSYAGGVVGNGAGLVEQNIQFVYLSLPKIISDCVALPNQCAVTPEEQNILERITTIVHENYSSPGRIQFVSERLVPGFFTTSSAENNRIAKTGLGPDVPIYFNEDELYDSIGKPAIDFAGISALLVHELGHQTGETSHTKLDILGAKVRFYLSFKFVNFNYVFGSNQSSLEMNLVNYPMPAPIGDLYLSTDSGASVQLTPLILQKITCSVPGEVLIGFNLTNGHWNHIETNSQAIDFVAWLQVFCRGSVLGTSHRDLKIRVSDKGEILNLEVE